MDLAEVWLYRGRTSSASDGLVMGCGTPPDPSCPCSAVHCSDPTRTLPLPKLAAEPATLPAAALGYVSPRDQACGQPPVIHVAPAACTLVLLPVILAYTSWSYRVFRGKESRSRACGRGQGTVMRAPPCILPCPLPQAGEQGPVRPIAPA